MVRLNKVVDALISDALTSKQIAARFRVKNPRDLVYKVRNRGYYVETFRENGKFKYTMTSDSR